MDRLQRYRNELNLALYCLYLKSKKKNQKRKTNQMIAQRTQEGVYTLLIEKYLMNSDKEFKDHFRLSHTEFDYVLSNISADLQPQPNNFRSNPISAKQKLCITLR